LVMKTVLSGTYDVDFMRNNFVFKRSEPPQNYKIAMMMATAVRVYKTEEKNRGEVNLISEPLSSGEKKQEQGGYNGYRS